MCLFLHFLDFESGLIHIPKFNTIAHKMLACFYRTSDSLNEGLPIKWPDKSFKVNEFFSIKKIVGSTLEFSTKVFFSLDK